MKLNFRKYFHSVLDPEEYSLLEDYLSESKNDREISSMMKTLWNETMEVPSEGSRSNPALNNKIKAGIEADRHTQAQHKLKVYLGIACRCRTGDCPDHKQYLLSAGKAKPPGPAVVHHFHSFRSKNTDYPAGWHHHMVECWQHAGIFKGIREQDP